MHYKLTGEGKNYVKHKIEKENFVLVIAWLYLIAEA